MASGGATELGIQLIRNEINSNRWRDAYDRIRRSLILTPDSPELHALLIEVTGREPSLRDDVLELLDEIEADDPSGGVTRVRGELFGPKPGAIAAPGVAITGPASILGTPPSTPAGYPTASSGAPADPSVIGGASFGTQPGTPWSSSNGAPANPGGVGAGPAASWSGQPPAGPVAQPVQAPGLGSLFQQARALQDAQKFDDALLLLQQIPATDQNYPAARMAINLLRAQRLPAEVRRRLSPGEINSALNSGLKARALDVKLRLDESERILDSQSITLDVELQTQVETWRVQDNELIFAWELTEKGDIAKGDGRFGDAVRDYNQALSIIPQFGPAIASLGPVQEAFAALRDLQGHMGRRSPDAIRLVGALEKLKGFRAQLSPDGMAIESLLREADNKLEDLAEERVVEVRRTIETLSADPSILGRLTKLQSAQRVMRDEIMVLAPGKRTAVDVSGQLELTIGQTQSLSDSMRQFRAARPTHAFGIGQMRGVVTLLQTLPDELRDLPETVAFRGELVAYAAEKGERHLLGDEGTRSGALYDAQTWLEVGTAIVGAVRPLPRDLIGLERRIGVRKMQEPFMRFFDTFGRPLLVIGGLGVVAFLVLSVFPNTRFAMQAWWARNCTSGMPFCAGDAPPRTEAASVEKSCEFVPDTKINVCDRANPDRDFLTYWKSRKTTTGELILGKPIMPENTDGGIISQYFYGAKIVIDENKQPGDPYRTGLANLGDAYLDAGYDTHAASLRGPESTGSGQCFQNNHLIAEPICTFFREYGGYDFFGVPITSAYDLPNGKKAQWFQKFRLETDGKTVEVAPLGCEYLKKNQRQETTCIR